MSASGRRRGLADSALAGGHGDHVADARQRLQATLDRVRRDLPADRHPARSDRRVGRQPLPQGGLEASPSEGQGKAQFDLDPHLPGLQPDGLHSFGVRQRHPEVGFDIIPDQQAG